MGVVAAPPLPVPHRQGREALAAGGGSLRAGGVRAFGQHGQGGRSRRRETGRCLRFAAFWRRPHRQYARPCNLSAGCLSPAGGGPSAGVRAAWGTDAGTSSAGGEQGQEEGGAAAAEAGTGERAGRAGGGPAGAELLGSAVRGVDPGADRDGAQGGVEGETGGRAAGAAAASGAVPVRGCGWV